MDFVPWDDGRISINDREERGMIRIFFMVAEGRFCYHINGIYRVDAWIL